MGVLQELGFDAASARTLLIEPPDHALAEASSLAPRPAIASSVMTAQPAALVAWWPEGRRLDAGTLGRLHWMMTALNGAAWVVFDPGDADGLTREGLRATVAQTGFSEGEVRPLSTGEVAVQLIAGA